MPRHVWRGTHPLGRTDTDEEIQPGETFEPREAELDAFGDQIETAEPETCQAVKDDGEVCGRDLPCRYHSD